MRQTIFSSQCILVNNFAFFRRGWEFFLNSNITWYKKDILKTMLHPIFAYNRYYLAWFQLYKFNGTSTKLVNWAIITVRLKYKLVKLKREEN